MTQRRVPFFDLRKLNQSYEPALTEAIRHVVDSGIYIRGREVQEFETSYARYTGSLYCVGTGNGFDALRLIFRAWMVQGRLQEGDEVLVPANTYIASILAVTENRLRPVFVDCDANTMNIDIGKLEEHISERTRALLVVHLYGRSAMTSEAKDVSQRHGLLVVEDNAQAAGCGSGIRRTGSLGHAAAHSFFPTKNLGALGDGGAVTTNDEEFASVIRTLGHYGSREKGHNELQGVNSRLDEIQAAVLKVKLQRLDQDNAVRRSIAARYRREIVNPLIRLPGTSDNEDEHVWHLFVIRSRQRDALKSFLSDEGIETLIHYPIPPHRQPAFSHLHDLRFPLTEQLHDEALSLPLHPALSEEEVSYVIECVTKFNP